MSIIDVVDATSDTKEKVTAKAAEEYLACLFLRTSNIKRYHVIKLDLAKNIPSEMTSIQRHLKGSRKFWTSTSQWAQVYSSLQVNCEWHSW